MSFTDTLIQRFTAAGIVVVDLRGRLPRNTTWLLSQQWSYRPPEAVTIFAHHYPAGPPHPPVPYDEVGRITAWARMHVNQVWGYDNAGRPYHAPTIAYCMVNGGSGRLYVCNEATAATWHANDANGIALSLLHDVGEGQEPTYEQLVTFQRYGDVVNECPEIPADQGNHWGHGELTQYRNGTLCPGRMLPYVQRYRATGRVVTLDPLPPEPSVEVPDVSILTQEQAVAAAQKLWESRGVPYFPDFAIPKAWLARWQAGQYPGLPATPELQVEPAHIHVQGFDREAATWKSDTADVSWDA